MTDATVWRGRLDRYYTHGRVAETLMGLHGPDRIPCDVLDLCAGSGSLTSAAGRRWPSARITTLDVDGDAAPTDLFTPGGGRHVRHDALDPNLPEILGSRFDAVVCNPPYVTLPWRDAFAGIMGGAGLEGACRGGLAAPASVILVAQALRSARPGGWVGLVVPDAMATGRSFRAFRESLMGSHRLDSVVRLPRRSFHGTEAQCFLLSLRAWSPAAGPVRLMDLRRDGTLGPASSVEAEVAATRMDGVVRLDAAGAVTLASLGASVARGRLSPGEARGAGFATFHVGDFPSGPAREAVHLGGTEVRDHGTMQAGPGDILMARLGRGLHRKVCLVAAGHAALTCAVLRIRVRDPLPVARWLMSEEGAAALEAVSRGTGARMVGKADLMQMPILGGLA